MAFPAKAIKKIPALLKLLQLVAINEWNFLLRDFLIFSFARNKRIDSYCCFAFTFFCAPMRGGGIS